MVQKIPLLFNTSGSNMLMSQNKVVPVVMPLKTPVSKVSMTATISHNLELKHMLRVMQGLPRNSGCSTCGKKG